jgi:hypothetical protein
VRGRDVAEAGQTALQQRTSWYSARKNKITLQLRSVLQ